MGKAGGDVQVRLDSSGPVLPVRPSGEVDRRVGSNSTGQRNDARTLAHTGRQAGRQTECTMQIILKYIAKRTLAGERSRSAERDIEATRQGRGEMKEGKRGQRAGSGQRAGAQSDLEHSRAGGQCTYTTSAVPPGPALLACLGFGFCSSGTLYIASERASEQAGAALGGAQAVSSAQLRPVAR